MNKTTIKIVCPKNINNIRKITIYLPKTVNGSVVPAFGRGCEFSDGSDNCLHCMEKLLDLALKDPTMESYQQPISLYTIQ